MFSAGCCVLGRCKTAAKTRFWNVAIYVNSLIEIFIRDILNGPWSIKKVKGNLIQVGLYSSPCGISHINSHLLKEFKCKGSINKTFLRQNVGQEKFDR